MGTNISEQLLVLVLVDAKHTILLLEAIYIISY